LKTDSGKKEKKFSGRIQERLFVRKNSTVKLKKVGEIRNMELHLINSACGYAGSRFFPFHTPGHKGKWFLPCLDSVESMARADIADDIGDFPAALERSEEAASRVYGTLRTFYLVNGSTAGIQAMLLSVLKPGDKVVMGRNLHVSAISALVMTGALPVYVPLVFDDDGIPLNVLPEDVGSVIEANPDSRGVFLTSPSYFCVCTRMSGIAEASHRYGIPLLIDEAWGGHFPFGSGFPRSSLETGADIAVHGVHKTMSSLTGTALLHVNSDRVEELSVASSLRMVETTSPNILFYMSLEYAIHKMKEEGGKILEGAVLSVKKVSKYLNENSAFETGFPEEKNRYRDFFSFDPIKLLVRTAFHETGITGYDVAGFLSEKYRIYPEMADLQTILFLFTGFEDEGSDDYLAKALVDAFRELRKNRKRPIGRLPVMPGLQQPVMEMTPREAFFSQGELVPLSLIPGRTVQSAIVPYPPGIPLLMPGEKASPESMEYIRMVFESGGNVKGLVHSDDGVFAGVVK
jgi:arginine decarboxylase